MATGNPVVVTAVGDIPRYLDASNSFIVEPDNNVAFAEQIVRLFSNYPKAIEIGRQGKIIAGQYFDYKIQASKMHYYIQTLL